MRRSVILLACAAVLVSGCDFLRSMAGRPTSQELDTKRVAIEQAREEARKQAVLDSLEQVRLRMEDSLAVLEAHLLDSLTQTRGTILNPTRLGGLFTTKLEAKYYIIVGAFRTRSYAERKLARCNEAGYTATIISFRSGLLAVGVCPSDSLNDTWKKLNGMRGNDICPKDAWILVNE